MALLGGGATECVSRFAGCKAPMITIEWNSTFIAEDWAMSPARTVFKQRQPD